MSETIKADCLLLSDKVTEIRAIAKEMKMLMEVISGPTWDINAVLVACNMIDISLRNFQEATSYIKIAPPENLALGEDLAGPVF